MRSHPAYPTARHPAPLLHVSHTASRTYILGRYSISVTNFLVDGKSVGGHTTGLVDSGTTFIYLPSSLYGKVKEYFR